MSRLAETIISWIVNFLIVVVMPIRLGLSDTSFIVFLLYGLVCGVILTMAEDARFLVQLVARSDVRGYLAARIGIVAVLGMCPFLIAKTFA